MPHWTLAPQHEGLGLTEHWRGAQMGTGMETGPGALGRESDLHAESHHHRVQMAPQLGRPSFIGSWGYTRC